MALATFAIVSSRGISAVICGSVYAWSMKNVVMIGHEDAIGFPFNQYFVFIILALGSLVMAILTFRLPASMDSKREES